MKLKLRKFDYQADLTPVFKAFSDIEMLSLISNHFVIHTQEMFSSWITEKFRTNYYHDFFMIETVKSDGKNTTVGFVFSYDFNLFDGHCKFTLCIFPEYQKKAYGPFAAIKFADYIFSTYSLKQIFVDVYGYNTDSLSCNLKGGFEEVGILPAYRYYCGEYYDMHVLRMTRGMFYERYRKKLNKIS